MSRKLLSVAAALAMLCVTVQAQAGLFGLLGHHHDGCCAPCCAPCSPPVARAPGGCEPEPPCCAPEPTCCGTAPMMEDAPAAPEAAEPTPAEDAPAPPEA